MSKFRSIFLFLFFWIVLSSCEKVIEFDLAGSKQAIVIEATITNSKLPFTVLVSKTSPYFGAKTNNLVSGAKVSVRSEGGKPFYFVESGPGVYKLERTHASVGFLYIIDVEYEGVTYSASSFLNDPVPIVDLSFSYFDGLGFFDSGYKVSCFLRDPVSKENYYRLKFFVNAKPIDDRGEISLYSDKLFNGMVVGLGQRSIVFNKTDTLTIELQSIDKAAYNYFLTLENIAGNEMLQTASPANPISNFSNGALGYFSAYSFDRRTLVVNDYINK